MLSADDAAHDAAADAFERLLTADEPLVSHNYVLVETTALVQRRLGVAAVAALRADLAPVLAVEWIDQSLHEQALAATIAADSRDISLVDRVSFELMRRLGIPAAFAFDDDFAADGFRLIP